MWKCKNCNNKNDDEYKICIHCFRIKDKEENSVLEIKDKIEYCKLCENSKFDKSKGILCALSNKKPDFKSTCENFSLSQSAQQKIEVVKKRLSGELDDTGSGGIQRWLVSVFGILSYVLSQYLIFDGEHSFISGILSFVVGGLIGYFIIAAISDK